jgi:death on curing protein
MIVWLRRETIIALHERHVQDWPTAAGIRSEDAFREAMNHPRLLCSEDPIVLAAAYGAAFCRLKPFNGGNKHAAFGACVTFLDLAGFELAASSLDIIGVFNELEAGGLSETGLSDWLRLNVIRISSH